MRNHLRTRAILIVAAVVGTPMLAVAQGIAPVPGETASSKEFLDRPGQPPLEGRLAVSASAGVTFLPVGAVSSPITLAPGSIVSLRRPPSPASAIPPLFRVSLGQGALISGTIRSINDTAVILTVPWQKSEVRVLRPGVQAVLQRAGEARIFVDRFERIDSTRWTVVGKPEVLAAGDGHVQRGGVRLPAAGASIRHILGEPLASGRIEMTFLDDGAVTAGPRWTMDLAFRGPMGTATLRVLLGWAEESMAVESPDGPALAVQRLVRSPGWHRLSLRFSPEQTEISVDGRELAHGKAAAGPLESIMFQTAVAGNAKPAAGTGGVLGEIQLVRFSEPSASLEIDPSQDELRLVVGDQLYGTIRRADAERVVIDVNDRPVSVEWAEIAGLYFRRQPATSRPVEGVLARLDWAASPGETLPGREIDHAEGAVAAMTDGEVTLETPFAGTLTIPRDQLTRLRVFAAGRMVVLDPAAHHLGDNLSSTPPVLDPPFPEGGILERSVELATVPAEPAVLALDVVQVVGEMSGAPYSNLVAKGELRTFVAVNGKRIDYINHYITTANETPERIRIPVPPGLLKAGKNLIRIEQTGIAGDPTWFDDLGILQIALQFPPAGQPSPVRPASTHVKP